MSAGGCKNLRNRWFGSHATQEEFKHERSSFRNDESGDYASNRWWRVSFIISLRRQARIFIDYTSQPPQTHGIPHQKKSSVLHWRMRKREREREGGRRGRDI